MQTSRIINKLLGNDEKVIANFSLSRLYLKIRMFISLFIFLLIFIILAGSVFLFVAKDEITNDLNYSVETGFTYSQEITNYFDFRNIDSSIINIWLIILAIYLFIIIPITWLYYFYYIKISHEYVITDKRIIIKRGWLNIKTITISYNRMTDAVIKQDLIDRIIRIGTLSISTAGSDGYEVKLSHIEKPNSLKKILFDLKESYIRSLYRHRELDN
jgi:membrane protein YdbS with pleckstrin-like domain